MRVSLRHGSPEKKWKAGKVQEIKYRESFIIILLSLRLIEEIIPDFSTSEKMRFEVELSHAFKLFQTEFPKFTYLKLQCALTSHFKELK